MADCIVKPSFLRGFDFKVLYASSGLNEYRTMSVNPLNGEIIACPYGGNSFLRSIDWGYTFEDFTLTGVDGVIGDDLVVYDTDFGLNRHALAFTKANKNLNYLSTPNWGVVLLPTRLNEAEAFVGTANNAIIGDGVVYGNGAFCHNLIGDNNNMTAYQRWFNGGFIESTFYTISTSVFSQRWGKGRGQWVYAPFQKGLNNTGSYSGISKMDYPVRAASSLVTNFVDATTLLDISDFINYDGVLEGGAALITRGGTIWHHTTDEFQDWVAGATPEAALAGFTFPHLAAGKGKFGEPVLLSLDSSGTKGILSRDHGATQASFDLPQELSQTMPGGVSIPVGVNNKRFPRVYDLKYVPDPVTNFTKGRWILCGGYAIWELIPVYGE